MSRAEIIRDFLANVETAEEQTTVADESVKQAVEAVTVEYDERNIDVELVDTNEINVTNIYDSKGRMSDAIDAVSRITGYNVIPLSATDIPKEVEFLQRHTLYTIDAVTYAMSNEVRTEKVEEYCTRIMNYIAQGVVFTEKLNRTFTYGDLVYPTLDLTKFEWTLIMSKFKNYKRRLFLKGETDLFLEIQPERV